MEYGRFVLAILTGNKYFLPCFVFEPPTRKADNNTADAPSRNAIYVIYVP
jgi:hypothetical protein